MAKSSLNSTDKYAIGRSAFRCSLAFILTLLGFSSFATHIVGGEISYTWQGNNNYLITLKVYRDCSSNNVNGTPFDDNASIGIFSSNGNLYENVAPSLAEADVNFIPVVLENPCFVLPPDVCVESAVYTITVNLPPSAGGYDLVYQRCCRNPSIINIVTPQDSGATFTTHIPGTSETTGYNSSAQFINFPPPALCADAEFFFDHSALDLDGDSLVYEFCNPLNGGSPQQPAPTPPNGPPFDLISFSNGFSATYPIASNPAFSIDPQTGFITGTANQIGQYVIGVCVSEYRNGVLINTSNRDFQFNVTLCDPNIIATIPQQTNFCDGFTVQMENNSVNASFFLWDFGVPGINSDTSSMDSPQYTYADSGVYTITLIANPGWPCADTAFSTYAVLPVIQPGIALSQFECVNNIENYNFTSSASVSALAQYTWDFGAGSNPATSNLPNPQNIQLNTEAASYTVNLTIIDNGCTESTSLDLTNPPDPVAGIEPQSTYCEGLIYDFVSTSQNAASYFWEFNTAINGDNSALANPQFTFPDTGAYNIVLIARAPFTCPDTAEMTLFMYGLLDPFFETSGPQCLNSNSFDFAAEGASTSEAQYNWDFGNSANPSTSTQQSPQNISYSVPDYHTITLTISENGCVETFTDSIWVVLDPTLDFDLVNAEGCPELYVNFNASVPAQTQVFYNWDFGDGTTSALEDPVHIYAQSGTYDVTLEAYTATGCVTSLSQTLASAVWVYPVPTPGFLISPQTVDILQPTVSVEDVSVGSTQCLYTMSDGGISEECNFDYDWTQAGRQTISQYVFNEFGCSSSAMGEVIVSGFLFFAPNAFSPNDDGTNDAWRPVMTGVSEYSLKIFNRWGDVIFSTNDMNEFWMGEVDGGSHYVQDGAYNYLVELKDLLLFPHDFSGHINLIR